MTCHNHHSSKSDTTAGRPSLSMRSLLHAATSLLVGATIFCACEEEQKEVIDATTDPDHTPTMVTTDVSTLISDSGVTRYKITTPMWYIFDEAAEPRWTFPNGLHLEKFDPKFKPDATIDCDSAIYFKDKQLWRLDGYVNIRNTLGEKFITNQLFWNQREQKIYSDSFIHIEKEGRVIEGFGFESNEQMTRYEVLKVAAIFPASQFHTDSVRNAPVPTDSLPPAPAPSSAPPPPPSPPATRPVDRLHRNQRIEQAAPHQGTMVDRLSQIPNVKPQRPTPPSKPTK